jgi:hypothetical protein
VKLGEVFTVFAFAGLLCASESQLRVAPVPIPPDSKPDRPSMHAMPSLANASRVRVLCNFPACSDRAKYPRGLYQPQALPNAIGSLHLIVSQYTQARNPHGDEIFVLGRTSPWMLPGDVDFPQLEIGKAGVSWNASSWYRAHHQLDAARLVSGARVDPGVKCVVDDGCALGAAIVSWSISDDVSTSSDDFSESIYSRKEPRWL